jgi:hypothetical protein
LRAASNTEPDFSLLQVATRGKSRFFLGFEHLFQQAYRLVVVPERDLTRWLISAHQGDAFCAYRVPRRERRDRDAQGVRS